MGDISIWVYPWDLHDIGFDAALERIAAAGANMVSLATSYHAGRFLQPGNPKRRVYFPQDGTVYYTVDPARWRDAEIAPLQSDIVGQEGDYLARLIDARDAGGPKVSCWTVCLHNTRLGMAHPDHVMRTAHGDPHLYGLCPSSPAARAYVTGLCAEIGATYRPDRIELESPDFMGFDHGYHHEKDGLGLLDEDSFLLGVCFCEHCMAGARAAGVDAAEARDTVARHLDRAFARPLPAPQFPAFPDAGPAAFRDFKALHDFLQWRFQPVTALIGDIRAATHADTRILLIDGGAGWRGGVDLSAAAAQCDGILACVYFKPADAVAAQLGAMGKDLRDDQTLVAGFQLFHPEIADAADLRARVRAAKTRAEGLNFYNLGLVPASRLPWMRAACDGV